MRRGGTGTPAASASTRLRRRSAAAGWRSGRRPRGGAGGRRGGRLGRGRGRRLRCRTRLGRRRGRPPGCRRRGPGSARCRGRRACRSAIRVAGRGRPRSAWSGGCGGGVPAGGRPAWRGWSRRRRRGRRVPIERWRGPGPGGPRRGGTRSGGPRFGPGGPGRGGRRPAVVVRKRQTPPGAGSRATRRLLRSRTSVPTAVEAGQVGGVEAVQGIGGDAVEEEGGG